MALLQDDEEVTIVQATNCNRSYAAKGESLGADFESLVIDFKDMPIGSIQARWSGATTPGGTFKTYVSNFPDVASFDPLGTELDCGTILVDRAAGSTILLLNRDRVAFRYALVRYTAGSTVGGTVDLVAIGKKT